MIEVQITHRAPRIMRNGRLTDHREAWEAVSTDGLWHFDRLDEAGTPWLVTFEHCPGWFAQFGSLTRARQGAERQFCFDFCIAFIHAHGLQRPPTKGRIYLA